MSLGLITLLAGIFGRPPLAFFLDVYAEYFKRRVKKRFYIPKLICWVKGVKLDRRIWNELVDALFDSVKERNPDILKNKLEEITGMDVDDTKFYDMYITYLSTLLTVMTARPIIAIPCAIILSKSFLTTLLITKELYRKKIEEKKEAEEKKPIIRLYGFND